MGEERKPRDPEPTAAVAGARPQKSVLTFIERKLGEAPHVTLREEASDAAGAAFIDPKSEEKLSLPQGRAAYQLMGEIARGGMGVILKGHDTDLGRDVAMKVLHKDLAERPEIVQRFVEEAQIGGQLQHPGIVPVYELGLMADERPYFTMKLVKGRTLASLLEERRSVSDGRRRMIDIFESVCQTMAYAHSRGLIHRDLKPANVMVGAFGEVQVVDWGLAKVLARGGKADEKRADRTRAIQTVLETVRTEGSGSGSDSVAGSIMGTPAYMSPEQAQGQIDRLDERSDVFSLGATLCEILTGLRPYEPSDGPEDRENTLAAAALARTDAALARLDACGADRALVELCKECLLTAPAARPRNAGVLAERVHDYITSVEERASAAQLEAAEARHARRLTAWIAVAAVAIFAVAGGGWVFVQNERAAREREVARHEQDAARRERALAASVGEALTEASHLRGLARWTEALAAIDRARVLAESGAGRAGDAELLERIEGARADVQRDAEEARRRDDLERSNQRLVAALDEVQFPRGNQELAFPPARERAYARLFREHGLDLDAGTVDVAAASLGERGLGVQIALVLDDWMAARAILGDEAGAARLLELAHRIDPDPLRADLREAVAARDTSELTSLADLDLAGQPAATLYVLGSGLEAAGAPERSVVTFREAVARHPEDFQLHVALGRQLYQGANDTSEPTRTRELEREARSHYWAALALRPQSRGVRTRLGRLLMRVEDPRGPMEAERVFLGGLPYAPDDVGLLRHAAWAQRVQGKYREALETMDRAVAIDPSDVDSRVEVGRVHEDAGDLDQAVIEFEQAVAIHPSTFALVNLGSALRKVGRLEESLTILERVEELATRNSYALAELSLTREALGDLDGAAESLRRQAELAPESAGVLCELGRVQLAAGHVDEAIRTFQRAVALEPDEASGHLGLGHALFRQGDRAGALNRCEMATELAPDSARSHRITAWILATPADDGTEGAEGALPRARRAVELAPETAASWSTLGVVLYRSGAWEEARDTLQRSLDLGGVAPVDQLVLAMAHHRLGEEAPARDWYRRALEWMEQNGTPEEYVSIRREAEMLVE